MAQTSKITNLRDDSKLTDADKVKMGTDGQVMLVKTLTWTEPSGVSMTMNDTEFYNTVTEAETAKAAWDD
jgi:hypothetical protein